MTRLAITRALPDAERTAARVRATGATPVLAPLLSIEPVAFDADLAGVQALLFTSAAGARAFAAAAPQRGLRVLAVGDATAGAARAAGFADVVSADGDGAALAALAAARLDPAAGKLLHISGADIAGDLAGALAAAGFAAERRVAYRTLGAPVLPQAFAEPLDVVLFHSAAAARVFISHGAPGAARLVAACLSPRIAAAAAPAPWLRLVAAPQPRESALIAAALSPADAKA